MRRTLGSVCVYCGSRPGARPEYREAAIELGRALARKQITLVFGGASVWLMGAVTDATLDAGGDVIGILPRWLEAREVGHERLKEHHIHDSMHTRKARMNERSDAFVALPGGLGTFEARSGDRPDHGGKPSALGDGVGRVVRSALAVDVPH